MKAFSFPESYVRSQLESLSPPYVFLETLSPDQENHASFLFAGFKHILTFSSGDNCDQFFKKIQSYLDKGYWLCGYFSYEFGYCLEPALAHLQPKSNTLLAWLGVCAQPVILDHRKKISGPKGSSAVRDYFLKNIAANITPAEYAQKITAIKSYLEQGLTYQVNFTFKVKFDFTGSLPDFYLNLRRSQPTAYAGVIDTGRNQIISLSPELFFRIDQDKIISRPMKGTSPRGRTLAEEGYFQKAFKQDKKIRAENVMIVDLLRNDLGRVSDKVWVPKLFAVERYRTLLQMTSTIAAELKPGLGWKELLSALFPCGSVTGAPKIKTMEIIQELEKEPRGIYTGAIGYISPQKEACFNVAIRTIGLKGNKGELGVGGGIVYDSLESSEYEEALLKARFFIKGFPKISLIESILLDRGRYFLLELHLKRLKSSARYFSLPFSAAALKRKLEAVKTRGRFKVRVLLGMEGGVVLEKEPLKEPPSLVKVNISAKRIDPKNQFLYHKSTQRVLYDQELARARSQGFWEVVFLNMYGELTEGAVTNLFLVQDNRMYTPPLKSGLLPGTLREHLLSQGLAEEKTLFAEDLLRAEKIYIGNSVRGLMEVESLHFEEKPLEIVEKA